MVPGNNGERSPLGIQLRGAVLIAQPQGERQVLSGPPLIIGKPVGGFAPDVVAAVGTFIKIVRNTQQKICQAVTTADSAVDIRTGENEIAGAVVVVQGVVLICGKTAAKLPRGKNLIFVNG